MEPFAYTIQYFSGAWFFDDVEDDLEDAIDTARAGHERNGDCYRVIETSTEDEVYRTDGISDYR